MHTFPSGYQRPARRRQPSTIISLLLVLSFTLSSWLPALAATQIDLVGPAGSGRFGSRLLILPNGNLVVTDPLYDIPGGATDVGAVYLYNGATRTLISMLTGSTSGDQVGSDGLRSLGNGHFVVRSPLWNNGSATRAGAATWINGSTGLNGVVSSSNTLIGNSSDDLIGDEIQVLRNGNYLVVSPSWDNGNLINMGAVTWGNGATGSSGVVDGSNSLIGSNNGDQVGSGGVTLLANGNYVVISPNWDNGAADSAGAVTWGNGATGISGLINSSNSLVGNASGATVGSRGVMELANGNYVVSSPNWITNFTPALGAVTWGNGATGVSGVVGVNNSLVGSTKDDRVGSDGVRTLDNGNYVISSPFWNNGSAVDAGAVTWGNGSSGTSGVVSSSNSLVGSTNNDQVGNHAVWELKNNNYLVVSTQWDNGNISDAGAVTWGNGATGTSGAVNSSNSLVGTSNDDQIGSSNVTLLNNGNYIVVSSGWANGNAANAGAVTWGNGATGTSGAVSSANSLVGTKSEDLVGIGGVVVLSNDNYVVLSSFWDNGAAFNVGAATWGSGSTGIKGNVNSNNSLVGSTSGDQVGSAGVTALSNGNYVVISPEWDNGSAVDAGAVTAANGVNGISGVVSSSNSLVGSRNADQVGSDDVIALGNGNYVVLSPAWDNGIISNVGAVTWGNGATGISGAVNSGNSLIGGTLEDQIGSHGLTVLTNDNYLVRSPNWDNGSISNVGAVTWGNGSTGISGAVNSSNSLIGSTGEDKVGFELVRALDNGNYVVRSPSWDNGSISNAGAATWGNGTTGISGAVNSSNSLVGSTNEDKVGSSSVFVYSNGDYTVGSPNWDNGALVDAGAITWGLGSSGVTGVIVGSNSVMGMVANAALNDIPEFDSVNQQLIVRRPDEQIVTILYRTPAEIAVQGQGLAIGNGDSTPVSNDGTDLGSRVVGSGALSQTFTISNTGDAPLTINAITLSGEQAGDFAISKVSLPQVVAPNTAFVFTLNFTPSAAGLRSATVNIASDDSNENPYTFAVQGTGSELQSDRRLYLPIVLK